MLDQTLQPSDSEALINNDDDCPFTPTPLGHYLAPASTPWLSNSIGSVKCATEPVLLHKMVLQSHYHLQHPLWMHRAATVLPLTAGPPIEAPVDLSLIQQVQDVVAEDILQSGMNVLVDGSHNSWTSCILGKLHHSISNIWSSVWQV